MFCETDNVFINALGELTLQKLAGEISADEFDYYASGIVKQAEKSDSDKIPLSHRLGIGAAGGVAGLGAAYGPSIKKHINDSTYAAVKQRLGTSSAVKDAIVRSLNEAASTPGKIGKTWGIAGLTGLGVGLAYRGGRKALQAYKNKNKQD